MGKDKKEKHQHEWKVIYDPSLWEGNLEKVDPAHIGLAATCLNCHKIISVKEIEKTLDIYYRF